MHIKRIKEFMDIQLNVFYPSKSDYSLALKISTELLRIGKPIPAIDAVISAVAINNGLKVITKDRHFLFVKDAVKDFEVVVED